MDRRAYLRSFGVTAFGTTLAGCSGSILGGGGGKFELVSEEAWQGYQFQPQGRTLQMSGEFTLEPGQYTAKGFDVALHFNLEYEFLLPTGHSFEVYIFERDEWENFKDQSNPEPEHHKSTQIPDDTNQFYFRQGALRMSDGDYVIAMDNTHVGEVQPNGETVEGAMSVVTRS